MWRPEERLPAALTLAILVVGVVFVAVLAIRGLGGGKSSAATSRHGPRPTPAQQHAVGVLSTFVHRRGSFLAGGDVEACSPNWRPPARVTAQLRCQSFGQQVVFTQFASRAQASAYFNRLASQGRPGSGKWGACNGWLPRSHWTRTILRNQRESGTVAFRQTKVQASVIWIWPDRHAVARALGDIFHLGRLCNAWNLNA